MVRAAYIEDKISRLVLVSDRAHGVSSQANGELEVLIYFKYSLTLTYNKKEKTDVCLCSPSGYASSPSMEQPGVEPRLQSDPQRLLSGNTNPVAATGLPKHNLQAVAEGGGGFATPTCRNAYWPTSWVCILEAADRQITTKNRHKFLVT